MSDRALLLLLAILVAVGSVATNLYIPALPSVREYFHASVVQVQATFSISLVTFAIGTLFWGPVADRYGRRTAILGGMSVVLVGATIGLTAQSLGWLVLGRGVQAFGTATGLAVSRAIISDRLSPDRLPGALANLAIVTVMTNGTAPIIGGYLAEGFGWRAVFAALIVVASIPTFLAWKHLPETRNPALQPPAVREMAAASLALLRNPVYRSCALQTSAAYSLFLVFVSLAPYVMVSALGRPPTEYGFYYLFVAVGYVSGNWLVGRLGPRHGPHWMVMVGGCLQAVGALASLAFMGAGLLHPLWMFVPIGVLYVGQGMFMPNMSAIAVSQAPEHAGVASSTLGFVQQMVGAVCVQLMGVTATDSAIPVLAFSAAASLLQLAVLWLSPRMDAGWREHRAA